MSSLKKQLGALAATRAPKHAASVLFTQKEAAEIDLESAYAIGCNGLASLVELDTRFAAYEETLFSERFKSMDRNLLELIVFQDKNENANLDRLISSFLRLLSRFFLQSPSMKAIEWIVRRFSAQLHNVEDIIFCIMPYHETPQFASVASILALKNHPELSFLEYLRKDPLPLDRVNLARRCIKSPALIKRICDMFTSTEGSNPSMSSFFARTTYECFDQMEAQDENFTRMILEVVLTTLRKSGDEDQKFAASVVLGRLIEKTSLAQAAVDEICQTILKFSSKATRTTSVLLVLTLYHFNPESTISLESLEVILLNEAADSTSAAIQKCLSLTSKLPLDGKIAVELCDAILQRLIDETGKYSENASKPVVEFCEGALTIFFNQHPVLVSSRIAEWIKGTKTSKETANNILYKIVSSTYRNTIFEPIKETGTILFLNLKHVDSNIRLTAYHRLVKILDSGSKLDLDCVEDILMDGLKDEEHIALAVLSLKNLHAFFSGSALSKELIRLSSLRSIKLKKAAVSALVRVAASTSQKDSLAIKEALFSFMLLTHETRSVFSQFVKEASESLPEFSSRWKNLTSLISTFEQLRKSEKTPVSEFDNISMKFLEGVAANMAKESGFDADVRFIKKTLNSSNADARFVSYILLAVWIGSGAVDKSVTSEVLSALLSKIRSIEVSEYDSKAVTFDIRNLSLHGAKQSGFSSEVAVLLWSIYKILASIDFNDNIVSSWKKTNNDKDVLFQLFITVSTFRQVELGQAVLGVLFQKFLKGDALLFLMNIWISESAPTLAKAKALEMACVMLDSSRPAIQDFQLLIPAFLLALLNSKKIVRSSSLMCLRSLNRTYARLLSSGSKKQEIFGKDFFYGKATGSILFLTSAIASKFVTICLETEKEILADPTYLEKKIAAVLSPESSEKQLSNAYLPLISESVTIFLLSNVTAVPRIEVKSGLLTLMSALNTPLKVKSLLPLIEERLARDTPEPSALDIKFRLQLIQGFTPKACSVLFSVKSGKYLGIFLDILMKGSPEEAELAVALMHEDWILNIPPAHQMTTFWRLMEIAALGPKGTSLALKKALTTMNVISEFVVYALTECHSIFARMQERSSKKAKSDIETQNVFNILSTILEMIESSKKLPASGEMLSILFDIIGDVLAVQVETVPFPVEYIKQSVVSVCLSVVKQLEDAKISVREDSIRVDLVVQCIRASDNPQTHNASLLLMASLAKLFPESVLLNIIPVFTFMGANVMRRDDNYSFFVIQQTLEVIIPALISKTSAKGSISKDVKQVSQIFVDSYVHIPKHRRLRLFILLISTLGPREFLHMLLAMLLQKVTTKAPGMSQDAEGIPAFCLSLLHHFDCSIQFESLIRFIESLEAMKDVDEAEAPVAVSPLSAPISGKALRYFKLACFDFTAEALGSRAFSKKLAGHMTAETVDYLLKFLELLLKVIDQTNVEEGDEVSASVTKFNRGLLKRLYTALNSLNLLLPFNVFLDVASRLIDNHDLSMRRRSILLLNDRVPIFTDEEFVASQPLLKQLLSQLHQNIKGIPKSESTKEEDVRQSTLACINSMSKSIAKRDPEAYIALMPSLLAEGAMGHSSREVRALGALCITTLCKELGPRVIPFLPQMMKQILQEIQDELADGEHLTFLQALETIIETLPLFVGAFLPDVLQKILGRSYEKQVDRSLRSQLDSKKQDILSTISEKIPTRIVVPVFQKTVGPVFQGSCMGGQNGVSEAALDFVGVVSILVGRIEKSDILQYSKELVELFLRVFDFRRMFVAGVGEEVLAKVETSSISAFMQFVLRLNESLFKPIFLNLRNWLEDRRIQQGTEHRLLTFYRIMDALMSKLKSIFAPYFTQMIDPSIAALAKYADKFNVDEGWKLIMGCLSKYFAFALQMPRRNVPSLFIHKLHNRQSRKKIYVTVIAETGTGTSSDKPPGFSETHPIYTLIQDVQVTSSNLFSLTEKLAEALNEYEITLIHRRQSDCGMMTASSELREGEVRSEVGNPFASSASLISNTGKPVVMDSVGFNSLDHALFALRLLPQDTQPGVIFLTDGVSQGLRGGDFVYRDSCRRLAKENVSFTVIQAGSSDGFVPSVNFGYVPDNESLRFLAIATFGKFIYGSDCKYLDVETITLPATTETMRDVPPPPNFYHLHLLMRDMVLTKVEKENRFRSVNAGSRERNVDLPRSRLINTEIESAAQVSPEELRFPWDIDSKPPLVAEILCGYRDYLANASLDFLVNARLLEGFSLRSVHISRKANRKIDKVEIILARPWLPNVTIQYTIKTVWGGVTDATFSSILSSSSVKPPRIELNILAHHAFAIQFVNVQDAEVKPDRLMKLHNYLRGVYDMDEMLKMVSSFNTEPVLTAVPKQETRLFPAVMNVGPGGVPLVLGDQNTGIWHVLSHVVGTKISFDEWDKDVILRPSSTQKLNMLSVSSQASLSSLPSASKNPQERVRLPQAFFQLTHYLTNTWSSFALNRQTYIKFLGPIAHASSSDPPPPPTGFAVLRLGFETDWLMSLKFSFFNASKSQRTELVQEICASIALIRTGFSKRSSQRLQDIPSTFAPLVVCQRPVRRLLVRYQFPTSDEGESVGGEMLSDRGGGPVPPDQEVGLNRGERSGMAAIVISRPPVRSYLRSHRWVWLADVPMKELDMTTPNVVPSHEIAFDIICRSRLEEGYLLVFQKPHSVTFYREIIVPRRQKLSGRSSRSIRLKENDIAPSRDLICSIQFVVLMDAARRTIVTELWAEPICDGSMDTTLDEHESTDIRDLFSELHEQVAEDVEMRDRKLIEKLHTFDRVFILGTEFRQGAEAGEIGRGRHRARTRDDTGFLPDSFSTVSVEASRVQKPSYDIGRSSMVVPTEYRLSSLLLDSIFSVGVFHVPFVSLGSSLDDFEPSTVEMPEVAQMSPDVVGQRRNNSFAPDNNSLSRSRTNSPTIGLESPGSPATTYELTGRENRSLSNSGLGPGSGRENRSLSNSGMGPRRSLNDLAITIPNDRRTDSEGSLSVPSIKLMGDPILNATTPRERIGLALHRFFERAVASVTDGEIPIGPTAGHQPVRSTKASTYPKSDPFVLSPAPGLRPLPGRKAFQKLGLSRMDLLESIQETVRNSMEHGKDILVSGIKHSVCFVKILDEQRFLLIFLPLYPATPKNVQRRGKETSEGLYGMEMSEEDRLRIRYLTLTIVECQRPMVRSSTESLYIKAFESISTDEIFRVNVDTSFLVNPTFGGSDEEINDGTIILQGKAGIPPSISVNEPEQPYSSMFPGSKPASPLAASVEKEDARSNIKAFMSSVSSVYSSALCRTIFFTLSQGFQIEPIDLDRALSSCVETKINIDLTGYLNVQILKSRMEGDGRARYSSDALDIQRRFRTVLTRFFQPVSKLLNEERNVFFFKPELRRLDRNASAASRGKEKTVELLRLLEVSETPFLIRTECSFRKSSVRNEESTHVPVFSLPVSYYISGHAPHIDSDLESVVDAVSLESLENDPAALDFSPHIIGTKNSPIESVDGTVATLHLVCLSLPKDGMTSQTLSTDDTNVESLERLLATRASCTTEKIRAVCETTRAISILLEDEIMDGLLHLSSSDDEASVKLVWDILRERHNTDLSAFSSGIFENTITSESFSVGISLRTFFLNHSYDTANLLKQEFQKMLGSSTELSIVKIGDLFRVVGSKFTKDHFLESSMYESAGEMEGLGITMSPISPENEEGVRLIGNPFWLLASFENGRCNILYFSKLASPVEKAALLRTVRKYVADCCEKVNRLILLSRVNETHKASKYLIPLPPPDKESEMQDGSSEDDENSCPSSYESTDSYIKPLSQGCFACPSVYRISFPVHWRLKSVSVLNSIVMTINPLLITNRKNMFVFATRESIYYFQISITEVANDSERDSKVEREAIAKEDLPPKHMTVSNMKESPKTPGSPSSRRPPNIPGTGSTLPPSRQVDYALTLEFFGVEPPSREITVDFKTHIETKMNALVQTALSTYLSRSVAVKLTRPDVEFILPIARAPHTPPVRREWLMIPESIQNPYLLLLLLRQYMLSFLSPLGGNDVATALRKYYELHFGFCESNEVEDESDGLGKFCELAFGDFSFLYNGVSFRNQTSLESSVGIGIASICLALIDQNGHVVTDASKSAVFNFSDNLESHSSTVASVSERWDHFRISDFSLDRASDTGFKILVEVWSVGSSNLDVIFEKIIKGFNETLYDYLIENCIRRYAAELAEPRQGSTKGDDHQESFDEEGRQQIASKPPVRTGSRIDGSFPFFIKELTQILKLSSDINPISVQKLSSPVKLPHWIIEEFAAEIQDMFNDMTFLPAPLIVKKEPILGKNQSEGPFFEIFRPARNVSETRAPLSSRNEDELVVMIGFSEFSSKYSNAKYSYEGRDSIERKQSFDSESSGFSTPPMMVSSTYGQARWLTAEDSPQEVPNSSGGGKYTSRRMPPLDVGPTGWARSAMEDVMHYSGFFHSSVLELGPRSCFLVMSIVNDHVSVFTYNWHQNYCDQIFGQVLRSLSWNNIRMQFLDRHIPASSVTRSTTMDTKGIGTDFGSYNANSALPNGISYSSSYGGVQGLGFAALQQFGERERLSTYHENESGIGHSDHYRRMFNMEADILQRHAVEYLDSFVRHIRLPHQRSSMIASGISTKLQLKSKTTSRKWDDSSSIVPAQSYDGFDKNEDKSFDRQFTISELADILRSVRLHFARCLLLFSDLRSSLAYRSDYDREDVDQTIDSDRDTAKVEVIEWHKQMISTFLSEYISYLVYLGMEVVAYFKPQDNSGTAQNPGLGIESGLALSDLELPNVHIGVAATPSYSINRLTTIDVGIVYLKMSLHSGILILQLSLEHAFVSVNVYTLKYPEVGLGDSENSSDVRPQSSEKDSEREFKLECINVRNAIHINSFSYDFHLRQIESILRKQPSESHHLNVLDILQSFHRHTNFKQPGFARSRLLHGEWAIGIENVSRSLFHYIVKSPVKYGFRSVFHDGEPVACFVSSEFPDFASSAAESQFEEGSYTYTVLIYSTEQPNPDEGTPKASTMYTMKKAGPQMRVIPPRDASVSSAGTGQRLSLRSGDGNLSLKYFVVIVQKDCIFPQEESSGDPRNDDVRQEYHSSGCYLGDITKLAERKIESLIQQAVRHYGRDSLWRQILNQDDPEGPNKMERIEAFEWTRLFLEKIGATSRSVLAIDPQLIPFFTSQALPWVDILRFLKVRFSENARELMDHPIQGVHHLLLFNPKNSDYLLHLSTWVAGESGVPDISLDNSSRRESSDSYIPPDPTNLKIHRESLRSHSRERLTDMEHMIERLEHLRRFGAPLAKRGEYQIDIVAVSREGVADEIEYSHINDVVCAISFWLWDNARA
ncbi:HEAT repeat-containing protein 1 [Dinochytrium kinnereticum]|nr:HEAT repeat-containing protein 1 [Dinochytrium kinnereticum]